MKDFLLFRRMVIPSIIQVLFWLGTVVCVYVGVYGLFTHAILMGLGVLIVGPIFVRVMCEYLIVQFKINDALQDIRQSLTKTS